MVTVKIRRTFVGGTLNGIVIEDQYTISEEFAPTVGHKTLIDKPCGGGSPFVTTIIDVKPAQQ